MDRNPPSSGDFAWSAANGAQMGVDDCTVLIGWLAQRVTELEALVHPEHRHALPTLPSQMRGFGCSVRAGEATKQAKQNIVVGALVVDTTPEWKPLFDRANEPPTYSADYVDWMEYEFKFNRGGRETTRIGSLKYELGRWFTPDETWMFRTIPDAQHARRETP